MRFPTWRSIWVPKMAAVSNGAIAEEFYQGIPEEILQESYQRLDHDLKTIIEQFKQQYS